MKKTILSREYGDVPPEDRIERVRTAIKPGDLFWYEPTGEILVCKYYFPQLKAVRAWGLPDEPIMREDVKVCRRAPKEERWRVARALVEGKFFEEPRGKVAELLDVYYKEPLYLDEIPTHELVDVLRRRGWLVVSPRQALEWAALRKKGLI